MFPLFNLDLSFAVSEVASVLSLWLISYPGDHSDEKTRHHTLGCVECGVPEEISIMRRQYSCFRGKMNQAETAKDIASRFALFQAPKALPKLIPSPGPFHADVWRWAADSKASRVAQRMLVKLR